MRSAQPVHRFSGRDDRNAFHYSQRQQVRPVARDQQGSASIRRGLQEDIVVWIGLILIFETSSTRFVW